MRKICFMLLAFTLVACGDRAILSATMPTSTYTIIPSPVPGIASSTPVKPTPGIHLTTTPMPRWVEYESALASVFLPRPYLPGEGLCEWEILGQTEKEVYVWAMCQVKSSAQGAAMSAPAVIHLGTDGKVQDVQVPGDGTFHTRDVGTLFPPNIQKRIFAHDVDTEAMRVNITARRITHAPPLIALSSTPMP